MVEFHEAPDEGMENDEAMEVRSSSSSRYFHSLKGAITCTPKSE